MAGLRVFTSRAPLSFLMVLMMFAWAGCSKDSQTGPDTTSGEVRFRTSDGFLLEGRLEGDGPDAVILAHMFDEDMSSWKQLASDLADDHHVLSFNFRGYGQSQGKKQISSIDRDVRSAIAFMRKIQGSKRIVLVGASMGGTASLVAAAAEKVQGVVAISAPTTFRGLDASSVVRSVAAKMLFIACNDDPSGASEQAQDLYKAALDPSSDLVLLPCSEHGSDIFGTDRGEEVTSLIQGFLSEVMT